TEITKELSLAKSTTTRILDTLEKNDFLTRDKGTKKYKLSLNLYFLGSIAKSSIQIREIVYPIMKELRNETKETVNLYLLEGAYRVCVEQFESTHSLKHLVPIGKRLPLWAGAGGKTILAYQNAEFKSHVFQMVDTKERLKALKKELPIIYDE